MKILRKFRRYSVPLKIGPMDLVIVSMHEKGFPQADIYRGCGDMVNEEFQSLGTSPDSFFTMKRGDSLEQAIAKAKAVWPEAVIVKADDSENND